MARWSILVVLALAVVASARNMPGEGDVGLEDQKNFLGYGFSGVGGNGLPFGGMGTGFDGGLGGPSGLGGFGGFGGPDGPGGFGGPGIGSGPDDNLPLP
ncbi:hypothetical protein VNO77_16291 [Canavalia gladiata]|uniref:Uncharacterized protein n=1 Tax=Canavalia gladiata TaxID=3824 RepID=A0AAN9M5L0_CANGL